MVRPGRTFIDRDAELARGALTNGLLLKDWEIVCDNEAVARDFATSWPSGFNISTCLDQLVPILARSPSQNWPV